MLNKLRRFWLGERGAVAVMFAVSLVPMIAAVGVSVDLVRSIMARSALQSSLDAGALAAAVNFVENIDENQANAIVNNYIAANNTMDLEFDGPPDITPSVSPSGAPILTVSQTGRLPTTFMRFFNIDFMIIGATTEVQRAEPYPVNLALVLDVTESMRSSPNTGGTSKIATLKVAAKRLVETVLEGSENSKVAIVPYAGNVRVYAAGALPNPVPPWIRLREAPGSRSCAEWGPVPHGCSFERYDCFRDGFWTINGCGRWVGSSCSTRQCLRWNDTSGWAGCIGSRAKRTNPTSETVGLVYETLNDDLESNLSRYPGLPAAFGFCSGSAVVSLTDDLQRLRTAIDRLSPAGDTYMPNGLIWGWNALMKGAVITDTSPSMTIEAFKSRNVVRSFSDDVGGKSVLILMTDGMNSLDVDGSNGRFKRADTPAAKAIVNGRTERICEHIDNDLIDVYTVMFDVDDEATRNMLIACASRPDMAFEAESNQELIDVFQTIADSFRKVRINR